METNELIHTLSALWHAIAIRGELTTSAGINQTLLDAAGGLCEIAGLHFKPKAELLLEEQVALLIVKQMEELVNMRMGSNQVKV